MSSQDQPLSALAKSLMEGDMSPSPMAASRHEHVHHHGQQSDATCGHGWWALVFYFLVIALVLYFVFFALRPSFVLEDKCHSYSSQSSEEYGEREINNGKLLGSALVGALLLILVLWLFSWLMNGSW